MIFVGDYGDDNSVVTLYFVSSVLVFPAPLFLKTICVLFFPLRIRLDELRMFLENETWELCPVKSNFSILQLHVSFSQEQRNVSSSNYF